MAGIEELYPSRPQPEPAPEPEEVEEPQPEVIVIPEVVNPEFCVWEPRIEVPDAPLPIRIDPHSRRQMACACEVYLNRNKGD